MEHVPPFDDAVDELRRILMEYGAPARIAWAFREDWYSTAPSWHRVVWPLPRDNAEHARALYQCGRARGLVQLQALFFVGETVVVNVFAPEADEVQGWRRGLKVSISQPFVSARAVRLPSLWRWHRMMPSYKRFQRLQLFASQRTGPVASEPI